MRRSDAEHIAVNLGVDRRTVHRQLAREGQTVSSLIEEVRGELGLRCVLEPSIPISDLAPLFGFHSNRARSPIHGTERDQGGLLFDLQW